MNLKDLRIEFYKSGGPGGQHKNKRHMACRVVHIPTGLTAVGQQERSQAANRRLAFARLQEKLREKTRKRKPRIPTKVPAALKERILDWKKRQGIKKRMRQERFRRDEA